MRNNLLQSAPLHYPDARRWMWNYCVYLGPFTDSRGNNYDLGICMDTEDQVPSAAIVHGNTPGDYYSGSLENPLRSSAKDEKYQETYNRAKALNLIES